MANWGQCGAYYVPYTCKKPLKIWLFLEVILYHWVCSSWCFEKSQYLHLQGPAVQKAPERNFLNCLIPSEKVITVLQNNALTQHYISEDLETVLCELQILKERKKCTTTDLPREKPLRYIGQYMQSSQYTGTTCCNIHTCAFCPQGVPFTCSIWLSQQVIQSINHLVSVMATKCIFCEVVRWELHF